MASPFFDLPPAQRNEIYELAAEDVHTVCVLPTQSGHVATQRPLQSVCRQLRREFGGHLAQTTPKAATTTTIIGHVVDFNFTPLMAYLKRIPAGTQSVNMDFRMFSGARKLHIDLTVTKAWCRNPDTASLVKWVKWLRKQMAAGARMTPRDVTYHISEIQIGEPDTLPIDLFGPREGGWMLPIGDALRAKLVEDKEREREAAERASTIAAILAEGDYVFESELDAPANLTHVDIVTVPTYEREDANDNLIGGPANEVGRGGSVKTEDMDEDDDMDDDMDWQAAQPNGGFYMGGLPTGRY